MEKADGAKFDVGKKSTGTSSSSSSAAAAGFIKGANWKKLGPKRGHRRNASDGLININNNSISSSSSSSSSSNNANIDPSSIVDPLISKSISKSMSKIMTSPSSDVMNHGTFAFPYSLGSSSLAWMGQGLDSVDVDAVVTAPSIDEFGSPRKGPPLKKANHRRAHSESLNESFLADFFHTPAIKPASSFSSLPLNNTMGFTRPDTTMKQGGRSNAMKMNQLLASQDAIDRLEGTLGMSIDETVMAPLLKVSSEDWHETFQKQSEGSNEYHEMDFFRSHSFDTGNHGYQVTADLGIGFSTDLGEMPNYSNLFQKPLPFLPAASSSSSGEEKVWTKPAEIVTESVKSSPSEQVVVEVKTKKGTGKEKAVKEKNPPKAKKQKEKEQVPGDQVKSAPAASIKSSTTTSTSSMPTQATDESKEKSKDIILIPTASKSNENSKTNINHGSSINDSSISSTIWHNAKDFFEKSGNGSEDGSNVGDQQQSSIDITGNNEKFAGRGRYRCGRCGVLKTNHKCEYIEADICSTGTQAVFEVVCQKTGQPFEGDVLMAVSNRASIHEPKAAVETYNYATVDANQQDSTSVWYRYPNGTLCLPTSQHEYATVENTATTTYSYIDADGNVALLGPNQAIHYEPDGTAYIITYDTPVNNSMAYGLAGMTINSDGTLSTSVAMSNELMQMNISSDQNDGTGPCVSNDET